MKLSSPLVILMLSCFSLALAITLAVGGGRNQQNPEVVDQKPAHSLLLGLIPEQDIFKQKKHYQPLADYLGQKIGIPVTLKIMTRSENYAASFEPGKLDGAFLGSFAFAMLHKKLSIEPLARPVSLVGGSSTYRGLLFVRKDSGIRSAKEMRDKRFAFVETATTAGYLFPLHYFQEMGIADYPSWFSETYFAGTHANAINDVLNKKAAAGVAKNTIFEDLAQNDPRLANELRILARSPEVPENTLAVRNTLDPLLKMQIKNTLLTMDTTREGRIALAIFGAKKFIATHDQDFQTVYRYATDIGLNLITYDSQNDR